MKTEKSRPDPLDALDALDGLWGRVPDPGRGGGLPEEAFLEESSGGPVEALGEGHGWDFELDDSCGAEHEVVGWILEIDGDFEPGE